MDWIYSPAQTNEKTQFFKSMKLVKKQISLSYGGEAMNWKFIAAEDARKMFILTEKTSQNQEIEWNQVDWEHLGEGPAPEFRVSRIFWDEEWVGQSEMKVASIQMLPELNNSPQTIQELI